jgi:hypothetical protein
MARLVRATHRGTVLVQVAPTSRAMTVKRGVRYSTELLLGIAQQD